MGNTWEDMANRTLKTAIAVFKTPAVYTSSFVGGVDSSVTIQGVFERVQHSVDLNTGASVDSFQPSFGVAWSDLTDFFGPTFELQPGDRITVNSLEYRVNEKIEDGENGAKLLLSLDGN